MRNGQNKHRMRGRNRGGKSHNPLTRVYESNGPDVKIRGTANHVAEKYIQLARDATASGDPVAAENYYQHAEHYFRLIAAAQEQFRQSQPFQQRTDGTEEGYDEGDEAQGYGGMEPHTPREQPQPHYQQQPREQHQQPREREQHYQPRNEHRQQQQPQPTQQGGQDEDIERLPSFITGSPAQGGAQQNGYENQGDRFPLHRRRRRGPRGPRSDMAGGAEGGEDTPRQPPSGE
jgi:hypothetical protein